MTPPTKNNTTITNPVLSRSDSPEIAFLDGGRVRFVDPADGTSPARSIDTSKGLAFSSSATQEDVWRGVGLPLVDAAFAGVNNTCIAWGAGGAGKTRTVLGCASDPGLLPRLGDELCSRAAAAVGRDIDSARIEAAMLEMHGGEVRAFAVSSNDCSVTFRVCCEARPDS